MIRLHFFKAINRLRNQAVYKKFGGASKFPWLPKGEIGAGERNRGSEGR